jgi:drug/metabolite transporter (DMT)-like permease
MSRYKGFLFVIISAVIFGAAPLFSMLLYEDGADALNLALYRALFCLPLLFVVMLLETKKFTMPTMNEMIKILIISLANLATSILLMQSYKYISSGTATTIHFIYPVFVLVGCMVFFKEPVNKVKVICTVFCLLGVYMFYVPGDKNGVLGLIIAFISGITYAFYVVYLSKSGLQDMDSGKYLFFLNLITAIIMGVYLMFTKNLYFSLSGKGWFVACAFSIVFVTGLFAFQLGIRDIGPQRASILSTFEPITSVIIGGLIFNEAFTVKSAIGIVLILISVVLLTVFDRNGEGKSPKTQIN